MFTQTDPRDTVHAMQ